MIRQKNLFKSVVLFSILIVSLGRVVVAENAGNGAKISPVFEGHLAFEPMGEGQFPPVWYRQRGSIGKELHFINGKGMSGGWAFYISLDDPNAERVNARLRTIRIPVSDNMTYRASVWTQLNRGGGAFYLEYFSDGATGRVDFCSSDFDFQEGQDMAEWVNVVTECTAPEGVDSISLRIDARDRITDGYFDNVELFVVED